MTIPARRLLAYAGPGVPIAAMGLPLVVFLPPYYATELGFDLALVGLVFGLVRALDTAFDPLVGHWADNTRTRFGRFKPWIAGGGLLLMASVGAVFFPPEGIGISWLIVGLLFLYCGYSLANVPHVSWGATLSNDYHERSRVYSYWQGGHILGLVLVLALPAILSGVMGADAPPAVHGMGAFILIAIPITIVAALVLVPRTNASLERQRFGWSDFRRMVQDPGLRLLLIADVSVNLAAGATGTLFRFFAEDARGFTVEVASLGLLFYFVSGLLALPLWLKIAKRIGKAKAGAYAALYGAVAHIIAAFMFDADNLLISVIAIMFAGLAYAAPGFLLRAMLADLSEVERAAGRPDRVGLYNAALTTAQKVGYVIPVAVLFPILSLAGFDPGVAGGNSPEAIRALELIWLIASPILLLPAIILQFRYRADQERHISGRAAARDQGGSRP
ncbi:MFS transporter [Pacificimonas sp. WHA3]|uniref:MFS transporter n=1 Tax=Pacificimonas pallii TaxID=2827236 RepID=A0ABS6SA38_9SPHN|nr:MFS transporter [Pacificimonas pallii]MBV7255238.1 MFS transporter [Pacificimonas pallii]